MQLKYAAIFACLYVSVWLVTDVVQGLLQADVVPASVTEIKVSNSPLSGGETTVFNTSREAFAKPLANLPTTDLRAFTFGNKMFNTKWVTAPASVTSLDGLGPTFNRMSCAACHFKDGRGRPPRSPDEPMKSMLIRLSSADGSPHPIYGKQLNDRGIQGVPAEGRARVAYEEVQGEYPDGTSYSLRRPNYEFFDMAFGALGDDVLFSPRVALAVHGMGLLEAIPEVQILSWADPEDKDGDGISGRPNYVIDAITNQKALGRFGWKANVATLHEQDAGAALGDMGITTSLFSDENCPAGQEACQTAPKGDTLDMSDEQLEKMTFYVSTLAVPARRDVDSSAIVSGARAFEKASCVQCHQPKAYTGRHDVAALSNQAIQPFTDLLLHDMGEGLADNRPDGEATGREWRTPPLWGIGLVKTVNKHTNFLHDGRARNLEEAILWHGGEAESSKQKFMNMPKGKREDLIAFLNSL